MSSRRSSEVLVKFIRLLGPSVLGAHVADAAAADIADRIRRGELVCCEVAGQRRA